MKYISAFSTMIFILISIIFHYFPRTEIETDFINQTQIGKTYFSNWNIVTSYKEFESPSSLYSISDKKIYLGLDLFNNKITYVRYFSNYGEKVLFVSGIHNKEYSYLFICLLIGLQFYILLGMNHISEQIFVNAYCIFLIIIQFLYMLRLFLT